MTNDALTHYDTFQADCAKCGIRHAHRTDIHTIRGLQVFAPRGTTLVAGSGSSEVLVFEDVMRLGEFAVADEAGVIGDGLTAEDVWGSGR